MNPIEKKHTHTQLSNANKEKICEFIKNEKNLNQKNIVDNTQAIN
jgi:hypothetical protein